MYFNVKTSRSSRPRAFARVEGFLFGALLMLSGCGSHTTRRQVPATPQLPLYTMHVDGVECQFCAQSVLDIVSKYPGVCNAKYHTTDATYKESHLTFSLDPVEGGIDREKLQADLEKDGFALVSLEINMASPGFTYPGHQARQVPATPKLAWRDAG